jgi:hypothetical protein
MLARRVEQSASYIMLNHGVRHLLFSWRTISKKPSTQAVYVGRALRKSIELRLRYCSNLRQVIVPMATEDAEYSSRWERLWKEGIAPGQVRLVAHAVCLPGVLWCCVLHSIKFIKLIKLISSNPSFYQRDCISWNCMRGWRWRCARGAERHSSPAVSICAPNF